MPWYQALFLGIFQGIAEFIPVSSSGHLVIIQHLFNIELESDALAAFDVILHAGSLLALLIYFRKTWLRVWRNICNHLCGKGDKIEAPIVRHLVVGTAPILIIGYLLHHYIEEYFSDPQLVLVFMFILGLVFISAEHWPKAKNRKNMSIKNSFLVGCAQAIALIPGISRSGSTITAAMWQGINRQTAAEFSFILGTPALIAATSYVGLQIFMGDMPSPPLTASIIGFISSFIVSWFCLKFLLKFLQKHSLRPFAYYLLIFSSIMFFVI
ncbi:MAG TPA: undecaprenyl-diphosphatase UppP, partial [Candidatus Gracilibacteria bacterium]|nr:undecaprenyl-diphosphatase UppP [Candidatus Gracilibacteria bacterium]